MSWPLNEGYAGVGMDATARRNPEKLELIIPRVMEPVNEVEEVRQLAADAQQARADFEKAGQAFTCIANQINALQEELMQAALDMHAAKCRADAAVAAVKSKAGLI